LSSPTWRQRFELARFDLTDQPLASFDFVMHLNHRRFEPATNGL